MIDYVEAVPDLELALSKHFGITEDELKSDLGKELIGDVMELFIRHNYLSMLTGRGIALDVFSGQLASAFYQGSFGIAYDKTKRIQEACIRVIHQTAPDADPSNEDAGLYYIIESFIEEGLACNEEELFCGLTPKGGDTPFVVTFKRPEQAVTGRYLLTELIIANSDTVRSLNFFDSDRKYKDFLSEIIFHGSKY